MSKVHNFSAGPAILPQSAIDASVAALQNFAGTGLSLIEVSHRSKEYEAVVAEATQLVKDILKLDDICPMVSGRWFFAIKQSMKASGKLGGSKVTVRALGAQPFLRRLRLISEA